MVCGGIIFFAAFLGFIIWLIATAPLILHVPDGESPLPYWNRWREQKWYKKLDKIEWFLVAVGIAMAITIMVGLVMTQQ